MKNRPSLKRIKAAANVYFGYDVNIKTRKREIVRDRQVACYVAHKIYKYSQGATGLEFNLDHATVRHACKTIANEMPSYPKIRDNVRQLTNKCTIKDFVPNPEKLVMDLLTYSELDLHIKIELRRLLKYIKNEGI